MTLTRFSSVAQLLDKTTTPAAYSAILDFLATVKDHAPYSSYGNNFWQTLIRNWQINFLLGMISVFIELISLPLLLLGLSGLKRLWNVNRKGPLLVFILFTYVTGCYFHYIYVAVLEDRFLVLPAIFLLLGAGLTIRPFVEWIDDKLRLSKKLRIEASQIVVGLAIVLLLIPVRESIGLKHRIHIPVLREAGLWAKSFIETDDSSTWRVAVNTRRLLWFTGRKDADLLQTKDFEKIDQWLLKTNSPSIAVFLMKNNQYDKGGMSFKKSIKTLNGSYKIFRTDESKVMALAVWANQIQATNQRG